MALTTEEQRETARAITRSHYGEAGNTANLTVDDWEAAVAACDAFIEAHQADFIAGLPEPFKSTADASEMRLLFVRTVMARVGLG